MKYVTEERTVQVPRVVQKQTPYTYTERTPRTVVTKVPLDACGNPLPIAPPAASAARPASPTSTTPPALPAKAEAAAGGGPIKTYSDRPADAAAAGTAEGGWGSSNMPHVDTSNPATGASTGPAAVSAERPAIGGEEAEPIPSPAASDKAAEPTIAPLGPKVEPAPPAHDERDIQATGASGRPLLRSLQTLHTT